MAYLSSPAKAYLHPPNATGGPYVSAKAVRIQASDERESDETTSNEEETGDPTMTIEEDTPPKPYDETWRWGIWQSRDAKRAATGYTDHLISHMPESFRFQREVLDGRNIALGAKLLLALNAASILLAYVLIWLLLLMFRNPADCDKDCQINLHNCAVGDLLIEVNGGLGRVVADIVYLVIVIPTVIYCFMWEVSEQDRHVRRRIYLVMLIIVYVRLWLMFMYPVGVHCSRAKRALTCGGLRHSHEDLIPECRNFGFFLLNKDMGLVMVSPVVIPECAKMRPVLWSITGVFYLVAMLAVHQLVKTPEQRYHAYFDTLIGLIFLFLVNEAARQRKWYMERADQVSFVLALRQRKASHSMFQILAYMLPSFMVTEMLRSPEKTLSDHIPRASILFIKIVDFDTMVRRLPPADVLQKLNGIFSALDNLCKRHSVTKIETVAEEYVCAVGIVPADREQDSAEDTSRHLPLIRLVYLAGDVLDYTSSVEDEKPKFQMGIHTGPVIAGVVGQKLPRFRLFGDTVNTAARMMQKGIPNEVQFGDETRRFLPEHVRYRSRGPIQMKGKGAMNVYLLIHDRRRNNRLTFSGARHRMSRFSSTVQIAQAIVKTGTSMGFDEPDDVEMFEDALMDAEQKQQQRWIDWLDCKCGDEQAKHFREWYYRNHLFKKLVKRLDKQLIFIFVLSFVETIYLADSLHRTTENPIWRHSGVGRWLDHECEYLATAQLHETAPGTLEGCKHECLQYGPCNALEWTPTAGRCTLRRCESFDHLTRINASETERWFWINELEANVSEDVMLTWDLAARQSKLTTFICSRAICFSIILVWRILVSCSDMVTSKARVIEWLLVISCCVVSCLLFLTYEMMPERFVGDKNHRIDEVIPFDFPISGVSRNITRLIAFPVYMMTITAYPFRFFPCCVFLLGTLFIMWVEFWRIFPGLYLLPTYGDLWYFFCFNLLRQFYAYQEEKLFRTQHAAGCAVERVMSRVHSILDTMMPKQVVREIAENPDVPLPSHKYRLATIVQADLVGFTEMAASREPVEVVRLIEQIFKIFDDLTDFLAIYKIETVGDAYIAGMAEPPLTAHHSPVTVLRFSLAMVEKLEAWSLAHGENVRVRVGVHSGGCVGGVVGKEMQRYHLFGSAMPVLDLLESTSLPGFVQISTPCMEAVQQEMKSRNRAENPEHRMQPLEFRFLPRTEPHLPTSKGGLHSYAEVGGPTYFLLAERRYQTMPAGEFFVPSGLGDAYPTARSC